MQQLRFAAMLVGSVSVMGLTLACQPQAFLDTQAAEERAIRQVDAALLKAPAEKDLERILSFFAEEGSMFPPNAPIATGKEAIRGVWSQLLASPGLALTWQMVKVEVSRAGDLAYAQGTYELTTNGPKGQPVTDRGKWVSVLKKRPDGTWQVVADIFNSDQPLK